MLKFQKYKLWSPTENDIFLTHIFVIFLEVNAPQDVILYSKLQLYETSENL